MLPPPPSRVRLLGQVNDEVVRRGQEVFNKHSCGSCHTPPAYTSNKTHDVGLSDEAGHQQFNPPSLRGVSQGGPYFHDHRAATLEEVFTRHHHQLKGVLTQQERNDLLRFLDSL
jgi:cytochrome c peroxidase